VSLEDFKGQRVVLFFFPKAKHARLNDRSVEFRDAKRSFDKQNTVILGVSADRKKPWLISSEAKLNFCALLGDPTHKMIEAYGVWRPKKFMAGFSKESCVALF